MDKKWKNSYRYYGALAIGLHWFMLLLIIAVYACIELRELYPKGSDPRELLKSWHFFLGLTILALVWFRLFIRWSQLKPVITPDPEMWQRISARFLQILLYILMIGLPVSGWLMLSAAGKDITFYGIELPVLITKNKPFASDIEEIHELVGTAGYYLIALHALAALFHHYIIKDNTLRRMLPDKLRR